MPFGMNDYAAGRWFVSKAVMLAESLPVATLSASAH